MNAMTRWIEQLKQSAPGRFIAQLWEILAPLAQIGAIVAAVWFGISNSCDMRELRETVRDVTVSVENAANTLSNSVQNTTVAVKDVEGATERVNESVERTTAAVKDVEGATERVNESVERTTAAVKDVEGATERVNESVGRTTTAVEAVEGATRRVNESVGQTTRAVEQTTTAVEAVEGATQQVNESVEQTTTAVEAVEGATDRVNESVGQTATAVRAVKSATEEVNTSVGVTTTAVEALDQSVGDLGEIVREIEDPKLSVGDLIRSPYPPIGDGEPVYLVTKASGTAVTIRWIKEWSILTQSGCGGHPIRPLTSREWSQLDRTYGDQITSAEAGCFKSLIAGN